EYARKTVENRGMSEQISFEQGDVNHLPFDTDTFDWAWSSDCVGYAPMEPLPLINELARMVKPGGTVAVLAWSSQILLPGYPMLEARLNATNAGIAPFIQGKKPESHFFRALGWFREAGLENCSAHTFSGTVYAPLSNDIRDALTAFFPMRWENSLQELSPRDREEYFRLTEPDSPYFIINEPDYYAFFTYTMFRGQVRRAY
ncbi:MAG: methyltransferase domain-containing protein, partial [Candidatus Latescibacteria bacterium]|nr:methyltransferase domain-containing protein [Candidatus Latescibacterota bacterium]